MRTLAATILLIVSIAVAGDDRPLKPVEPALQTRIHAAVAKGVAYLRKVQHKEGCWTWMGQMGPSTARGVDLTHRGGITAISLYALAASGVPREDPAVRRGVGWILTHPEAFVGHRSTATYAASLMVLALTRIDPKAHRRLIRDTADALVAGQREDGMWGYQFGTGRTGEKETSWRLTKKDNSNTQFAVLALWAAYSFADYKVPRRTWQRVKGHFLKTQQKDGRWKYRESWQATSNSMTAAAIVSLVYAQAALTPGRGALRAARRTKAVQQGLAALPGTRADGSVFPTGFYWLYSLERVGTVLALEENAWYAQGALHLVRNQGKNGQWPLPESERRKTIDDLPVADPKTMATAYETSLALLFLTRATYPPVRTQPGQV